MKVIKGYAAAKAALTRTPGVTANDIPAGLKARLKTMFGTEDPEQAVRQIIAAVRARGDAALIDYARQIDQIALKSLEVSRAQIDGAADRLDPALLSALKMAAERIRAFHEEQKKGLFAGVSLPDCGQLVRPLAMVGVYAPGGTASYPSTVLMTAVIARVAGVKEIILATPPAADGTVPAMTLAAAAIAGVDRVFAMGGAQAIAALAFGTESVPKVDKICGPGNLFVMLAKRLVYGVVDIDGLQGPSEVIVIADETANPAYCAADLLAQAEHDALASSIMICTSARLAEAVNLQIEHELATLNRRTTAGESLETRGLIAVVDNLDQAVELANLFAPEHLSLMVDKPAGYLDRITAAGCVFVGQRNTVPLGDYIVGPSHVLPTGGTARFSSPLSVRDFIKLTSVVNVDAAGLRKLGPSAALMACHEGLEAHARAVEKRLDSEPE